MPIAEPLVILAALFGFALVTLPTALLAAEGLVAWVKAGPRVLPVQRESREVWIVTDGLDPYRYQSREQVQAGHDRRYRRWARWRKLWRFLHRLVGRRFD